jgi:hypothetical protein
MVKNIRLLVALARSVTWRTWLGKDAGHEPASSKKRPVLSNLASGLAFFLFWRYTKIMKITAYNNEN